MSVDNECCTQWLLYIVCLKLDNLLCIDAKMKGCVFHAFFRVFQC